MKKMTASFAAAVLSLGIAGTAAAADYSFSFTGAPLAITEGDWVFADIMDATGDLGSVTDVNVFVDISHTWMADLDIYLTHQEEGSSDWKYVQLYNQDGDFRNDMTEVYFDDQAVLYINDSFPPYGPDSFKPTANGPDADGDSNMLSFFNGDLAAGIWSLALFDNSSGDIGTLNELRVDIKTDAVPLPGAFFLLAPGLGALAAIRRSRKN